MLRLKHHKDVIFSLLDFRQTLLFMKQKKQKEQLRGREELQQASSPSKAHSMQQDIVRLQQSNADTDKNKSLPCRQCDVYMNVLL